MKWHTIQRYKLDTTEAMEMGTGVLVRSVHANQQSYETSESMCFVPGCVVIEGGCGEYASIRRRGPVVL